MEYERTAAAYIRVSTEEQTELSPDSQLKEIRKYAEQHNIELLEDCVYIDAGISGRNTKKRPAFNKMIGTAKIKPKPFDVILLWKFSRFARNREDSIVYKSMLRKEYGIDVISISEALGDDKTSVLIEALIEAMDEYYSINLSEEVKRGMLEKVERGGIVTIPSFGYKIKDGNYIIEDAKANVVRNIFNDYLNGTGVRELAVRLNNEGILTSRGGKWENRTVEYILRNPVYVGKIRWNPERKTRRNYDDKDIIIIQGTHEPIIDIETFNKTQDKLLKAKVIFNKGEHQGLRQTDFMLRGIVKCSNCGLTLVQAVKGVSLQCHGYAHGKCSVSHNVAIHLINKAVLNQITDDVRSNNFLISPQPGRSDNTEVTEQIDRLDKKLHRIMDAYENGVYDLNSFVTRKSNVEKELKKLNTQIKIKKASKKETLNKKTSIKAKLKLLNASGVSETEKNLVLRQIVEKIVFNRKDNSIAIFYR